MKTLTKKPVMRSVRPNYYNLAVEEFNGQCRVLSAERFVAVNQHGAAFKRADSRNVARQLNKSKFVIN